MSAKRRAPGDKKRIQVMCSRRQHALLIEASGLAGADLSTWMLAHCLRQAGQEHSDGAPLVLVGPVADRLRRAAEGQAITASKALEQLLVAGAP